MNPTPARRIDVLPDTFRNRAERVVAAGRLVLAAFTLLGIWLDPSEPSKYAHVTYLLMTAYVVYSIVLTAVVWLARRPMTALGAVTHVADLLIFSVFMYLTEGPNSPFFSYYTFALLSATLRWHWRGALWTSLTTLLIFNGTAIYADLVLKDPHFELNRFIIRSVYLMVMGILLGYLGAHQRRLRGELAGLASWPRAAPAELDDLLKGELGHAAAILDAPRLLLAWRDADDQRIHLGLLAEGALEVWVASDESAWLDEPAPAALRTRFSARSAVSAPLRAELVQGRLFALDRRRPTSDDHVVTEVVARQLAASLDHFFLSRRLRRAAAAEERVRLSRDLHDGVLQSLTGAALQLQAVERLMERDPAAAAERLRAVRELVADEQRDLRFFVNDLLPASVEATDTPASLQAALSDLSRRLQSVWGLRFELELDPAVNAASRGVRHQIYRILQEASVNAARHGKASAVHVALAGHDGVLEIVVADNGHGFPFRGRVGHDQLTAEQIGPRTLRERVAALGGTLDVESRDSGSRLEMRVPLAVA